MGIGGFVVSAALLTLQSFVRGMYLGGLKGWDWNAKKLPLFGCGSLLVPILVASGIFAATGRHYVANQSSMKGLACRRHLRC